MAALFNFQSLLVVVLLLICTCAYAHSIFPGIMDRNKDGAFGIFWKFARIGERLSPYVSLCCVAMAMISSHCRKLQYIRQIVLVTNGRGRMDADDLIDISNKLVEDDVKLVVVGVDFDDATFGYEEENKAACYCQQNQGGSYMILAQALGGRFTNPMLFLCLKTRQHEKVLLYMLGRMRRIGRGVGKQSSCRPYESFE
ncbi:MAG: hypothetical protein M1821_006186 [Bathelium mastoideum]|nr:MAG: hypothetical protein M1821_006186 [Bathelium mastoideum]